jgi:hypothetical protein
MPKRATGTAPVEFTARIHGIWTMRYVDLPAAASAAFAGRHVPVTGTCNGVPLRGTLVPGGNGRYRLLLNGKVRKAAGGVDVGDAVAVTLRKAAAHRVPALPPELLAALARYPGGRLAFESWPPGRRRQMLLWLLQAKGAATRARRVARIVELLGLS